MRCAPVISLRPSALSIAEGVEESEGVKSPTESSLNSLLGEVVLQRTPLKNMAPYSSSGAEFNECLPVRGERRVRNGSFAIYDRDDCVGDALDFFNERQVLKERSDRVARRTHHGGVFEHEILPKPQRSTVERSSVCKKPFIHLL